MGCAYFVSPAVDSKNSGRNYCFGSSDTSIGKDDTVVKKLNYGLVFYYSSAA
jgi:hypothetical protein